MRLCMLTISKLNVHPDRKKFDCGQNALNAFLHQHARQHALRGLSRTFVLTSYEQIEVISGFFTLTITKILPAQISDKRLSRYPHPIPAVKLARLAVSANQQKNGFGRLLVVDAMKKTLTMAENVGIIGLFVDAKQESLIQYYQQFGFERQTANKLLLFLPTKTIERAFF